MENIEEEIRNVLVAEDDDEDFELLADAIRELSLPDLSLRVVLSRAENGDVLMKILHEKIPDLLFLDILMPCKDGKACVQEIRSHKKFDDLPIIVYSSIYDVESIEFFYRHGTNIYIFKPHTYREIVDIVQKVFTIDWKKMQYYPTISNFVMNPRH